MGRIRTALLSTGPAAVVSHESAGVVHRQWLPLPVSAHVHLTESGGIDRLDNGVRVHQSRLPADLVTVVDGLRVTSVARTAVDLARGRSLPEAMVAIDGAARALALASSPAAAAGLRGPERGALTDLSLRVLATAFESIRTWPGSVVVRTAIDLADPASESPFESRSRGWMVEARLPSPYVAFPVRGASGGLYVADFAWPERMLLGEADGTGKYGLSDREVTQSLRRERRRQRDIEDAGWTFVRWDSTERPATIVARLRHALST
jgi:hypothetical protein